MNQSNEYCFIPVSGEMFKWISKKHHRSCCLSSIQNQIPKIV